MVAKAKLQSADESVYGTPTAVTPDVAYSTEQGGRVEVYTSAGDNDGSPDWRSVNEFAYLINSVPLNKNLYATVFNSLYDGGKARLVNGNYVLTDSSGDTLSAAKTFRPSLAFLNQINQYDSLTEARKYVHVLGAKRSMTAAYNAPSTLARLLKDSGVMTYCSATSTGACLTTSDEDALMHSKYALFEQARDSEGTLWDNVIWVTSANLNGSSGGKKSNTSIAIFGDAAGFQKLRDNVWGAEVAEKFTTGYKDAAANGITGTNSDFSFYPSPRSTDFEAETLTEVANISGKTNCKANLVHSLFNAKREALLTQLNKLESQGCEVKVMLGENAISDVVDAYFSMSNSARELIDRVEFGNVHDKSITVSYTKSGVSHGITFGGSANANGTSLSHDELAFKAEDLTVTRAVEQQDERLYQLIRGGKANVEVTGLAIAPSTVSLNVGHSRTLQPRFTPSSATVKTVTWESSNTSVLTVNSSTGKITAVSPGTATITATSLSGNQTATAKVTVNTDSSETSEASANPSVITQPPTLSMDKYQTRVGVGTTDKKTTVVVTWGSGATDITGKVLLQYYDAGKWKTRSTITVTKGRGTANLAMKSSRAWRVMAKTPSGSTLSSAAKYSNGVAYNVVKTKANSTTPRIYAPTMAKTGDSIPFLVTWVNPSKKYPTKLRLQYLTSSGWETKSELTISGGSQKFISAPAGTNRKWRVVTAPSARKKGSSALRSNSVLVRVT